MAANSGDVNAGDAATAVQYNDLREDVVNVVTGHGHTGVSEDGKLIGLDGLAQEVKDTLGSPKSIQRFEVTIAFSGGDEINTITANQAITAIDLAKSYVILNGYRWVGTAYTGGDVQDVAVKARLTSTTNVELIASRVQNDTAVLNFSIIAQIVVIEWP